MRAGWERWGGREGGKGKKLLDLEGRRVKSMRTEREGEKQGVKERDRERRRKGGKPGTRGGRREGRRKGKDNVEVFCIELQHRERRE